MTSLLAWAVRNRALTRWHLPRYWRYLRLRVNPAVQTDGIVWVGKGVRFVAERNKSIRLGRHVTIGDHCRVSTMGVGTLSIGPHTVIGERSYVQAFGRVEIGRDVLSAPEVWIADFDHQWRDTDVTIRKQPLQISPVVVEDDCWLGLRSVILRGVTVGRGSVVGAHAVVHRSLAAGSVVVGAPATVVRERFGSDESRPV